MRARLILSTVLTTAVLLAMFQPCQAQNPASPSAAPAAGAPSPATASGPASVDNQAPKQTATPVDPETIVARVNGHEIRMRNLQETLAAMPPEMRGLPVQMLYPMLLTQAVDREALLIKAQKEHLERDPAVQKAMQRAQNEVLQNALLNRDIGPDISDDAIRARYDRDYKGKPGEKELHARHILVTSEDQAKKIIADVKNGASFEEQAKKSSKDPGSQNGGDLGWFKRGDMVPEFANAAFGLKVGEITQVPVHTQFGWHVIKLEGERTAAPQTLEQMHDQIRQALIQEGVRKVVADARSGLKIEEFAPDGSKLPAADGAVKSPEASGADAKSDHSGGVAAATAAQPGKH